MANVAWGDDLGALPETIKKWQDMRFGMFIHWGPVSLKGTEIGWSRGSVIPEKEYDALYKEFNPVLFNADEWVSVAKAAGMKYLIITSKHHDGFCLWPSKYTDYDIGETPFGRDVLKELSDACRKQGIRFGTYHSVCDWYHPDFPLGSPGGKTKKTNPNLDRYMKHLENQVTELITNYGPLSTMWFDVPQEVGPERGKPVEALVRRLQPDITINNRGYQGPSGDYDTPEQRVGAFNRDRPWETCMTICRQWAWKPNDTMKSKEECIQTLLLTVGGDGNLLFNVGPMPDGRIEPRQVDRLKEMGAWLAKHGNGVYGTRGGPFQPGRWGASTCKENKIFLYVMNWLKDGPLLLPPIDAKIIDDEMPGGLDAEVVQTTENISVHVPNENRDPIATVIELTVDCPAFDIEPAAVLYRSDSLAFGKKATASNVFQKMETYQPAMALDDNPETRWATDSGTSEAWMEVDLGEPLRIGSLMIDEPAEYKRIQAFELQALDGTTWKTFHSGTTIGPEWSLHFTPITIQRIRLRILKANEGPTIREFQVFAPSQ
ncbi:MAG: alpha-L-fucosidase [Pirellulales bacterium]|nr:alpha-L-fucosidase [Pirellulales bacterium]